MICGLRKELAKLIGGACDCRRCGATEQDAGNLAQLLSPESALAFAPDPIHHRLC